MANPTWFDETFYLNGKLAQLKAVDPKGKLNDGKAWSSVDDVKAALKAAGYEGDEGLYQHFKTICSEVSMPVILYNVPGRTGCNMLPPTVARIARDVPDVVGIKEATADLIHVSDLVEQCPEGFQILSGDDFTVLPHIAVGGCGVISVTANVAPKLMADLCKATLAGDMDEARRLHFKLMPINRAMFLETNPIPVKTAVCMMRGLDLEFRLPMVPLMPDNLEKLTKILNDCDLLH